MSPRIPIRALAALIGTQLLGPPRPGPRPSRLLPPLMLPEKLAPRATRLEPLLGGLPS